METRARLGTESESPVVEEPVEFDDVSGEHRGLQPFLGTVQLFGDVAIGHGVGAAGDEIPRLRGEGDTRAAASEFAAPTTPFPASVSGVDPRAVVSSARCLSRSRSRPAGRQGGDPADHHCGPKHDTAQTPLCSAEIGPAPSRKPKRPLPTAGRGTTAASG